MPRSPRDRILDAATGLLADGGRDAVTTRAVSAEANVQAQTIYRHFGDMRSLLQTVAADGFQRFLTANTRHEHGTDPVGELRAGWDLHIEFAQANPAIYTLMYGERRLGPGGDESTQVYEVLRRIVERAAAAGRLALPVDTAAAMIYATGIGVAMTLITTDPATLPAAQSLSANTRDAVLGAVTVDASDRATDRTADDVARHAIALRALLSHGNEDLSPAEAALFEQWLGVLARRRAAAADHRGGSSPA
ncbi:TetR/AcrR family transcriptional regulator [Williamsia maris]